VTGDDVSLGQTLAMPVDPQQTPLLASASGTVTQVDDVIALQTRRDGQDINRDRTTVNDIQHLQDLGVRGLGGAAYSTSGKLDSAAGASTHTLIINAAECEPLICCDQAVIREHASEIILGISCLINILQVERCLVGIEDSMPIETKALQAALEAAIVNADGDNLHLIEIVEIPTIYPTGSERQLIQVLTGIALEPQQLPATRGILCFNVSTALAVKNALLDRQPQIDRVITIAGSAVESPQNIRARFGTPVMDLLRFVNLSSDLAIQVTHGGPLTGYPIQPEHAYITAASNCILCDFKTEKPAALACIRCGECDRVCPSYLLPQQLHWYGRNNNIEAAEKFHLSACIECGCCDYVCPSNIPLTQQFRQAKSQAREKQQAIKLSLKSKSRFENRAQRLKQKEEQRQQKIADRKQSIKRNRRPPKIADDGL